MSPKITEKSLIKARTMTSSSLGKWFEREVQSVFDYLQMTYKFKYVRLYDTAAAGNYLPQTDGDYILMSHGAGVLAELKCSAKSGSLVGCASRNISKGQVAGQRLWARAGGAGTFIFGSVSSNVIEVWNGRYVSEMRVQGNRLDRKVGLVKEGALTDMGKVLSSFFSEERNVDLLF